ncbi:MAG: hypothetical protein K8I82_00780, partial [Anaerolineae bacterium]|nr:hypothetical protein [Anaerolineae bacterium]
MRRLWLLAAFFLFPFPQPITIHILVGHSLNEAQAEQLTALAADFNATHEDVKIVFDSPESAFEISTDSPPQIVGPVGIEEIHHLKGAWADLTPFIEGYSLERFYPVSLPPLRDEQQQIGL